MRITGIDHVQVAIPTGSEAQARSFSVGVLGLEEMPKPEVLAVRGGLWLQCGGQQIHLGIEKEFRPAKKAHPALIVDDLDELARELRKASYDVTIGEDLPGIRRLFVADPFGNRIAFLQRS